MRHEHDQRGIQALCREARAALAGAGEHAPSLGEFFLELYASFGLDAETAGTACSITMIFLGAALTAAGVYDDIAKRAGAGTLVPITGFANSVAAPALEFKTEGFITGTAAKMFVIAGPVIVYGASAGVVYGLILLLFRAV